MAFDCSSRRRSGLLVHRLRKVILRHLAGFTCVLGFGAAAAQDLGDLPSFIADEVRQRLSSPPPSLSRGDLERVRARIAEHQSELRSKRDSENVHVKGAIGSVSLAARCAEGHVVSHDYSASAGDVVIVSAHLAECEANACRTYELNAFRDDSAPFDLSLSVTCSG